MEKDPHNFYIIGTHDFALKSAGSTRMHYYARALASEGNAVYLISSCTTPLNDKRFVELFPNVYVLEHKQIAKGFFDSFQFLRRLHRFANAKKRPGSFLIYPTVFVALEFNLLIYLKLIKRRKVFYELNEVRKYSSSHEAEMSLKRMRYSLEKVAFKLIFNVYQPLLSFYDGLICISTNIEEYGKRFNSNTLRIPILTDSREKLEIGEGEYSNTNNFNIGFSGSIDPIKEDMGNFIDVVEKLNDQGHSISFNLCGGISKNFKKRFNEKCSNGNQFNYYGYLNELELSTFLSQQDLLVIPRGFTRQNNYGFSTKLSDYLNHNKMVLVTDITDNGVYIKDNENGFIVPPNDKSAMLEKIKYIIENFENLNAPIVANAEKTSKLHFDYWLHADKLKTFLKGPQ